MRANEVTGAALRTVRAIDLGDAYTQIGVQLKRLVGQGSLHRLARGVYYAPPDDVSTSWIPTMETATAAVATAYFGDRVPVLMHLTAARMHGAVPRALAVGIVAVPRQQKPMPLTDRVHGRVIFVKRDVTRLGAVLMATELGNVLATTREQTLLDLAKRPQLGDAQEQVDEAIRELLPRVDFELVTKLAGEQRARAALSKLRTLASTGRRGHVTA